MTKNEDLKACPWCDKQPQWGLTKKTGCQMHGDPIQYVTLGCNNPKCEVKPHVTGGDRYSNGETGRFFVEGEKRARELAAKYWNTRPTVTPTDTAMEDAAQREPAGCTGTTGATTASVATTSSTTDGDAERVKEALNQFNYLYRILESGSDMEIALRAKQFRLNHTGKTIKYALHSPNEQSTPRADNKQLLQDIADAKEMIGGCTGKNVGIIQRLMTAALQTRTPPAFKTCIPETVDEIGEWADAPVTPVPVDAINILINALNKINKREMGHAGNIAGAALREYKLASLDAVLSEGE